MAGITVHVPVKLELHRGHIAMDGVQIDYDVLPQLIAAITKPDPRKWYRFERVNETVMVHVRISEEEDNGTAIGTLGDARRSQEGAGREG